MLISLGLSKSLPYRCPLRIREGQKKKWDKAEAVAQAQEKENKRKISLASEVIKGITGKKWALLLHTACHMLALTMTTIARFTPSENGKRKQADS